ncbi:hypothetical protein IW150_002829 [Coemansia sp. RSA 2607]|nr:hypothetical protein IW150_002829 [Coemansia sp. RSA 2607]
MSSQHNAQSAGKKAGIFNRSGKFLWRYKKTALFVSGVAYLALKYKINGALSELDKQVIDGTDLIWHINHGSIVESTIPSRMGPGLVGKILKKLTGGTKEITMLDALTTLEMAADDRRVKSLIVRVTPDLSNGNKGTEPLSVGLGIAQVQELRHAVETFRKKKVEQGDGGRTYFYIDSFNDQMTYYLASAFSDIIVQPTGHVPLVGVSSTQLYFKRLTEKVGVKVHVEARKEYKSVVAPFSQESMPEKHRENLVSILHSLNDTLVSDIALTRGASIPTDGKPTTAEDVVRGAMEVGPLDATRALELGLISTQGYALDIESIVGPRKPVGFYSYGERRRQELSDERIEVKSQQIFRNIFNHPAIKSLKSDGGMRKLTQIPDLLNPTLPVTVGVVYLLGTIERLGAQGSHAIAAALKQAALDPHVAAIVLRIDSGGGDVVASDTIAAAVDYVQTKFGKPVVASYGNISASGAYYSSTSCNRIFASPGTITGSIGVASMRPVFTQKLLDFVGTNVEELYTVDNPCNSVFRNPEGAVLERYQRNIDKIYDDFTLRVAKGRGLTPEHTESVAKGQIFTGQQALANGLVDEIGGFTRAVEHAAQLGHESRVLIANNLFRYYVQRVAQMQGHRAVAAGQAASVIELEKMLSDDKTGDEAKPKDFVPKDVQVEIVGKGGDKFSLKNYKADILKNIKIKEFPETESPARNMVSKLFQTFVATTLSESLKQEINQLLSMDERSVLGSNLNQSQHNQTRVESDNVKFK